MATANAIICCDNLAKEPQAYFTWAAQTTAVLKFYNSIAVFSDDGTRIRYSMR